MDNSDNNNNITANQKIAVGVLLLFSVLVVFLWFIQFRNNLRPDRKVDSSYTTEESSIPGSLSELDKDTDGDGLLDVDELNNYGTSPYLEDSDSDGFSDFEEISSNNDPNCPAGRICNAVIKEENRVQEYVEDMQGLEDVVSAIEGGAEENNKDLKSYNTENIDNSILSGDMSPENLRTALIGAGFDKAMLDQISDEDLMAAYKDILSEQ